MPKHLHMKGPVMGLSSEVPFRPDREYTFCRICGELYQPALERVSDAEYTTVVKQRSYRMQRAWAAKHAKTHPDHVHRSFTLSGRFVSDEATFKLVPYGVIPISDLVLDDSNEHAGLEAPRVSDFNNFQW